MSPSLAQAILGQVHNLRNITWVNVLQAGGGECFMHKWQAGIDDVASRLQVTFMAICMVHITEAAQQDNQAPSNSLCKVGKEVSRAS